MCFHDSLNIGFIINLEITLFEKKLLKVKIKLILLGLEVQMFKKTESFKNDLNNS